MKNYEVHYFVETEGDGVHLYDVTLPETPQIGWVLIINRAISTSGVHRSGVGTVVRVVMQEGSENITVFLKQKK